MTNSILAMRLASLKANLDWLERAVDGLEPPVPLSRDELSVVVSDRAHYARVEINSINEAVSEAGVFAPGDEPWERFADLELEMRGLFRCCMELINGAAFRASREDEKVWTVADEFNRELALLALQQSNHYVTVPALDDAPRASHFRTVRVRFPDWTIWSLPLAGYEFAQAAVDSQRRISKVAQTEAARLISAAARPPDARAVALSERAIARRVGVLLSDAVATFILGPCYASATINLRLDPAGGDHSGASAHERAHVIFSCLREVHGPDVDSDFVRALEEVWTDAVGRSRCDAGTFATREDLDRTMIPAFVGALALLPTTVRLTRIRLRRATQLADDWKEALDDGARLRVAIQDTDRLRDVLNAAWLARYRDPDRAAEIEEAAIAASLSLGALKSGPRTDRVGGPKGVRS
jgi:hypothetical protein